MKTLGVDYGRKKIGLALAEGTFAEPLKVIRYEEIPNLKQKIKEIVDNHKVEKIVVGISEGQMAKETQGFVATLREEFPQFPIETFDETLSTQNAQELAISAGIGRKKRKVLEDAYAATLMLQNYLDQQV